MQDMSGSDKRVWGKASNAYLVEKLFTVAQVVRSEGSNIVEQIAEAIEILAEELEDV